MKLKRRVVLTGIGVLSIAGMDKESFWQGIINGESSFSEISGDFWGGKTYVCDKQNIYILSAGDFGDFYAETPPLTFESFDDKSIIYITVRCQIKDGFINIYTYADNGDKVSHKGISTSGKHRLPIRYNPGDTIKLRLEGSGDVCITEINLEVLIKKR